MNYYIQVVEEEFDVTTHTTGDLVVEALENALDFNIAILNGEFPGGQGHLRFARFSDNLFSAIALVVMTFSH